jgi:hypothetical protein
LPARGSFSGLVRRFDLIWLFVAAGIGLRLYQYLWNRSLFLDEAALALNLRDRSFLEMLQPLDHAQFGPAGLLLLQKALVTLFGGSEYVLRAPILVAGIAALVLFAMLARRILPARVAWLAVALLAVAQYPIFWSTDSKSYGIDLLACVILLLLAVRWLEEPTTRSSAKLAVAGAVLPYFSAASLLVLAGVGFILLLNGWRMQHRGIATIFATWLLALPAVTHLRVSMSPEDRAYFVADWWEGFLPLPFEHGAWAAYRQQLFRSLYDPLGFGYPWPAVVALIALIAGTAWVVKSNARIASLLLAPIVVTVAASMAGQYPIGQAWNYYGRVVLFLAPIAFLLIAGGFAWVQPRNLAAGLATFILLANAIPAMHALPYSRGEIRRALRHAEQRVRSGDLVYLFYAAKLPVEYYAPRTTGTIVVGVCSQVNRTGYIDDLERLRGRDRVWIVTAYNTYWEPALILHYMDRNATLLESAEFPLADVRLYRFPPNKVAPAPANLLHPGFRVNAGTECKGVFANVSAPRSEKEASTSTVDTGALFGIP